MDDHQATAETRYQSVRFHDIIVQIQTVVFDGIECLCLEDVQRQFPSVTALCIDNIQLTFFRAENGTHLLPTRIAVSRHKLVEALESVEKSRDTVHTLFDHIDAKMQEMDKKTDLILANTQETLLRLKHVMTLMYELHEYTTPRYFFILPVHQHSWQSINAVQDLFLLHYKLYFLCECSDEPNELHIAPHDGYSIKKPSEFVANYGPYLRTTLHIARGLLSVGGFVLPQSENVSTMVANTLPPFVKEPTNYTDVNSKLDEVEKLLNQTNNQLARVDASMIRKAVLPETPLQGAKLRELEAFLDLVDDRHSLGNLYRTMTDDGHIRWVCLEHYNVIGFNNKMLEYIRQLEAIGGKFHQQAKEAVLTGNLTSKNVAMLCDALKNGFTMLTLVLENCSIDVKDLDKLSDTILNRSSICRLIIRNVEVRKWMRMSRSTCDHMTIYFQNQSLKIQLATTHKSDSLKILVRLLEQNKICRSFTFSGYDLFIPDQTLLSWLKEHRELTTLVIHHFMNIDFLNKIITANSALRRLKLSFWFNPSSTLFGLCQAIEQNDTLVDLDIMDHTCVDDKGGTIELLKAIRNHKSIKHLRVHMFNVITSNQNEACLIDVLLHDTFITHLRLSDSTISPELILALVHASKEVRSLTHLEIYHSHLNDEDISQLHSLHTDESLTHLSISEQQYWSIVRTELQHQLQNEFPQYHNSQLEQKIAHSYTHSSICLDEMELIDQDMNIVVKQAIIDKHCKLLSLQSNKITSVGISILADALNNNNTLEILYLDNNYMSDDGVDSLAQILTMHNNTLKTLVLQKNRITDEGTKHLAELLKFNQTLIWLYLGENQISDEGVRRLAEVMSHQNSTLEMLVLSSNKLLTDTSIDYLLPMLQQNQTLKKLWIDNCSLSEAGKQRLDTIHESKRDFYLRV